ncbi:putative hydrophobic protein (TIGR00271 family) [Streptosporangium becharense]|uniref:Putative hydrophobic protein (TIGR00271 family) n=1 Tax=Streptosporangium becharense TaxID=1816182 RepID=A0A7W9IF41_9ACTN|nr:DUF389 domain-containing protein [Streptosporangium becharense]MBB2909473.1 putative hydrophobic protein (TIGR00271 family) [Streptosporangium becharense]MBB5819570.1 putative hydrophobic protein (TIGR00271 family) [Streptosporangium becharense]
MLHLRVISPAELSDDVLKTIDQCLGVVNLVVLPGAARSPVGDLIQFDVAREAANEVIERLQELGLHADGSIAAEEIDLSLSEVAERAQEEAPGDGDDAVVWAAFAQRVADDSRLTWAFFAFLMIATQLAAVGVIVNSPILIVGAMVLGPEFGPIAAICFGLLRADWGLIGRALRALAVGFAVAITVTFACALAARWLGWIDVGSLNEHKEIEFIVKPDKWSFIVALFAGAAGVLSVTAGKSSALVGVFISVTTVPAAGYFAVAAALTRWEDMAGSVTQLGVNIAGMIISGTLVLLVQRTYWSRFGMRLPAAAKR